MACQNRGLDALEKDKNTGKLYADHSCYFRCLAIYWGCGLKILERKTQELASTYMATLEHPDSFAGVRLRDLHALDNFFGMHTLVYALGEDRKVELVHRPTDILSKRESQAAFRLNLYGAHFSYVKHMTKYSRCFTCQRCHAMPGRGAIPGSFEQDEPILAPVRRRMLKAAISLPALEFKPEMSFL